MKSEFISLMILTCGLAMSGRPAFGAPLPDACRTGGFALGCQAWTFKEFTVLEAIQMTAAAGGKVIEFYPGQSFSADKPGLKWDHDATPEMIAAVRAQLEKSGVAPQVSVTPAKNSPAPTNAARPKKPGATNRPSNNPASTSAPAVICTCRMISNG